MNSLCHTCTNVRKVVSGTGSTFLLCQLSHANKRFPKYPPQPVFRCDGYEEKQETMKTFTLELLPGNFAISRLNAREQVPDWAVGEFVSITRTPDELSIVCPQCDVPAETQHESGWRCLRVVGPLDFSMVGVIASLTRTLASASISVFVISTFDTDYLLVKDGDLEAAVKSLVEVGHSVQGLARN
jgi:hypothetical protein